MVEQFWQWFLNPVNQKYAVSIVIALVLGLLAGRLLRPRTRDVPKSSSREGDAAFFKGIQYIISNDHDQAIEEFTKSVKVNSDTIETYVALGNLYRSRGDIDRAIRIRQSIIARPFIDEEIKIRALFDLGLDYRKGGFLNWALENFLQVLQKQPQNLDALEQVEKIYEEIKDWENAFATRQKISRLVNGDHGHILAHHQTEIGKALFDKREWSRAKSCFKKALSIDSGCVDAYLHLGDLYFERQEYNKAITTWKQAVKVSPRFTFLAYRRLESAYSKMKNLKPVEDFLRECAESHPDPFTHLALARFLHNEKDDEGALRELRRALELDSSFWEARKFMGQILLAQDMRDEALSAYGDLISHLNVPYLKFQCSHCGFSPPDLEWQCLQCRRWDTIDFMDSATVDSESHHSVHDVPSGILPMSPEEEQ
ncbi:MAG: tetratricopeptide repeat protein [Desulfatiglandales bacterium]